MNNTKLFEELDSGFKKYYEDNISEAERFLLAQNIELLKQEKRSAETDQVISVSLKDFFGYEIQTEFFRATLADLLRSIYILAEKKAENKGDFENFLKKTDKTIAELIASEKYFVELAENFHKIRQK